jgi:hypothetical protein
MSGPAWQAAMVSLADPVTAPSEVVKAATAAVGGCDSVSETGAEGAAALFGWSDPDRESGDELDQGCLPRLSDA